MPRMKQELNTSKLAWRCRRGMLELDLLLIPFFDAHFSDLSHDDQVIFQRLLECTDPELYTWLIGADSPEDKELQRIVGIIRQQI